MKASNRRAYVIYLCKVGTVVVCSVLVFIQHHMKTLNVYRTAFCIHGLIEGIHYQDMQRDDVPERVKVVSCEGWQVWWDLMEESNLEALGVVSDGAMTERDANQNMM